MGKRGPKPRPTQLKVLEGERDDRINHDEPIPALAEVFPPEWLKETAEADAALEIWHRLAPDLIAKGVLTAWDTDQFAAYCDVAARFHAHATELGQKGHPYVTRAKQGALRHPQVGNYLELLKTSLTLAARFGLTPSDRSQIGAHAGKGEGAEGALRLLSS